jgi:uncharacterized protein YciI
VADLMFLAISEYVAGPDERATYFDAHRAWSQRAYEEGVMLASGPQDPPVGGVLVFRAGTREQAEAFVASDPFQAGGVARYTLTAFAPTPFPWRSDAFDAFAT